MPFGDDAVLTAAVEGNHVDITITATGMLTTTIYRQQASKADVVVRGADNADVLGPNLWVGGDFEASAGVTLSYRATINDGVTNFEVPSVLATNGFVVYGGDYLAPVGQPNLGMLVTVEAGGIGEISRDVIRDVQSVLNRPSPVVVSYGRGFWEGEITFLTLEREEQKDFLRMMEFPVLFFVPRAGYGFDDGVFIAAGLITEERTSPFGYETSRRMKVQFNEVDRPPAAYPYTVIGDTWQVWLDAAVTFQYILDNEINMYDLAGYP